MEHPDDRRYRPEHTWVKPDGSRRVRVGITDHAQDQLSAVVFVDLSDPGDDLVAGRPFGEIESTKTLSHLIAPVTGTVVAVNGAVADDPELVNGDPYGDGWLLEVDRVDDTSLGGLLSAAEYVTQVGA